MTTTRRVNMLLTVCLLCTVSVVVRTAAKPDRQSTALEHLPSRLATDQSSAQIARGNDLETLLVDAGEIKLRGVSWRTGQANGELGHHPASRDVEPLQQVPNLKLVKEADPMDGLRNNGTLTFTLTLSGAGLNVLLWDPLPENVNYVEGSVTEPASFDGQANAITWQGLLPTDSPQTVRYHVTPTIAGTAVFSLTETIINTAWMTDTENDRTVAASVAVNAHRFYLPFTAHAVPEPPGWHVILQEDFEGAWPGPWDVFYEDAIACVWAKRNCRPHQGEYSGWAVGGAGCAQLNCGANYPHYVNSFMRFGPFSLENADAAELTFQFWLDAWWGLFVADQMYWGAGLVEDDFYGYFYQMSSHGWKEFTLDLASVPTLGSLLGESDVWILFAFLANATWPEGAYVDDIVLRKHIPAYAILSPSVPPGAPGAGADAGPRP